MKSYGIKVRLCCQSLHQKEKTAERRFFFLGDCAYVVGIEGGSRFLLNGFPYFLEY